MKKLTLFFLFGFSVTSGFAAIEGSIYHISRKFKLSTQASPPPKDYYMDVGEKMGVKVGQSFVVYREFAPINDVSGESSSIVKFPVGEIKVILVGPFDSVARLVKLKDDAVAPVLDYDEIMMGDKVFLKEVASEATP